MIKKINKIILAAAIAATSLTSLSAQAGLTNDVPGCYKAGHYNFESAPYTKFAYILVDQTVSLNSELQKESIDNAVRLLGPGTKFVVAEFSAFSQNRYLSVLNTGIIESPMTKSQRDNVPTHTLGSFDSCMKGQAGYSVQMVSKAVASAMSGADDLAQSDIMMALKTISEVVGRDAAKQKVVFVVTDGLENSSITSFYSKNSVRIIDAAKELSKAKSSDLIGDFGGARVYMLGAGVMPPAKVGTKAEREGYRDPKTLGSLNKFWKEYFENSNAKLIEFGAPALVSPVSF
jgi:hypothetical protein